MPVDMNILREHVIPIAGFRFAGRFTDEKWDKLRDEDLEVLVPLDKQASQLLAQYLVEIHEKSSYRGFRSGLYRTIETIAISGDDEQEIKKWLSQRGIPPDRQVFLSWVNLTSMIAPWRLLVQYWNNFYYPSSDDLTVFDGSPDWVLYCSHEEVICFGTNIYSDAVRADVELNDPDNARVPSAHGSSRKIRTELPGHFVRSTCQGKLHKHHRVPG